LWVHAAEFLLARSEVPPQPPADWRQEAEFSCRCEDCRELARFAADTMRQVHRFRIRQDRRSHVESQIRILRLDMSCVTERAGSPQTLVCTKTRRTYQRQCKQHQDDCGAMSTLLEMMRPAPERVARWAARLAAASDREP
jgi:predicted secreted protein